MALFRAGSILEQTVALIGSKPHPQLSLQAHLPYLSLVVILYV
jgi:hypothetical protein